MKIPFEILLLTSSVGALQSAFFGAYLFTIKKGNKTANRLLAFLLLAFAFRMMKSVSYYFAEGHSIPRLPGQAQGTILTRTERWYQRTYFYIILFPCFHF